jgi:hypothetical protein
MLMDALDNPVSQLCFRPSELPDGTKIPTPFIRCFAIFQNDGIQRPSNGHGLGKRFRVRCVGAVKLPHSAHIARGKAGNVWVCILKIFRSRDSRAFFWALTDKFADFAVQLHLRTCLVQQCIQRRKQCGVINGFSYIHRLLLSGAMRPK